MCQIQRDVNNTSQALKNDTIWWKINVSDLSGITGAFSSYAFDSGQMIVAQNYAYCIRYDILLSKNSFWSTLIILTDQLLDTAALNTHQLPGQSLVDLSELLLQIWTVLAQATTTQTYVPGLSIAMSTLLLFLAFNLHRLVNLMVLTVLGMQMGEKGTTYIHSCISTTFRLAKSIGWPQPLSQTSFDFFQVANT